MTRLVLDTNILLLDASNLITLGQDGSVIVLPEVVLEELDSKKGGFEEINFQARAFSRLLATGELTNIDRSNGMTITELLVKGVTVQVVALDKYDIDTAADSRNDQKIIAVAMALDDVILVSNDMMVRFRGMALGLAVQEFKIVEDADFEFVKELTVVDVEVFRTLHNADIMRVDPEYKVEHYSYKFTCATTGQMKLATVANGFISIIGKDTEKQLRLQDVAPMNSEQLLLGKAIQDPTISMVVLEAKSGSGKTLCAMSNAIRLMKTNKDKYSGILYIRNSVDDVGMKDEEIGFLSGNEEKMAVYLSPLVSTLEYIARNKITTKGLKPTEIEDKVLTAVDKLKEDYNIQGRISLGLRGVSLHNVIVLLDESQNMGPSTMQKILTRVGKDSKVIVMGSQRQIDSNYLNKHNNGLAVLMDECRERTVGTDVNLFAIQLHKVLRSPLSEFAEDLFSK